MSTEDGRNPTDPSHPLSSAEHDSRNRTQLEMMKVAVQRIRHAAYIDAMLEGRARGEPDGNPERTDGEKKDSPPDS